VVRARDLQPTPNRRVDFLQGDPELIDAAGDGPGPRVLLGHGVGRALESRSKLRANDRWAQGGSAADRQSLHSDRRRLERPVRGRGAYP